MMLKKKCIQETYLEEIDFYLIFDTICYMNSNNKLNWIHVDESKLDTLPESSAVYLVVVDTINNNYLVIYSGQAENIKERAKQHWSESEPNKKLKNIIKKFRASVSLFYYQDEKTLLDGHERYLFNRFEPQLQENAPDVEPIEINLPDNVIKGKLNKRYFE